MSEGEEWKKKKATVEALLFATTLGLTIKELMKRTGYEKKEIEQILDELEMEHLKEEKGMHIVQEGDIWKMSIKPEHTSKVKDILPPEFPKALMQTLAVIASKKPVKQSIVIHIRGNKAYAHIKKLLKMGFITAEKHGLTQILDVTQKFFEYFNIEEKEIKEKFKE